MKRGIVIFLTIAVLASAAFVACGDDDDDDDQAGAESKVCEGIDSFQASVAALQSLDPSTASQDDYEAAVEDVRSDWDALQEDVAELEAEDQEALEEAYGDLDQAIEDAPEAEPVDDALATLSEEITAISAVNNEIRDGLTC
jgi:chromosome segregation ATPase